MQSFLMLWSNYELTVMIKLVRRRFSPAADYCGLHRMLG